MSSKATLVFALDTETNKTRVSQSEKGSTSLENLGEITQEQDALLYDAVRLLSALAEAPEPDMAAFKAMQKVCEILYAKHQPQE